MAEITTTAGVSKGTFFNYFPAKEHLLREWYRRITVEALEEARGGSYTSSREAILRLLRGLASRATADTDLYAMKERHAFADGVISEAEGQLGGDLAQFLREHLESARVRDEIGADIAPSLCAAVILAILTGTAHEWVVAHHAFDLDRVLTERIDFVLQAAKSAPAGG